MLACSKFGISMAHHARLAMPSQVHRSGQNGFISQRQTHLSGVITMLPRRGYLMSIRAAGAQQDSNPTQNIVEEQQLEAAAAAAASTALDAIDEATVSTLNEAEEIEQAHAVPITAGDAADINQDDVLMAAPSSPLSSVQNFFAANPVAYWSLVGIGGFLAGTFVIALFRTFAKGFSSKGKRSRTVNKNKAVVEELGKYLPANRSGLSGAVIAGIRLRTGFSPVELFRKYLWFLLRERKFDQEAVDDLVALKSALGLSDAQVGEALGERAKRVYDKYGNVMLDTTGMSPAGIERKATARSLFSKMLYLVENEALLAPEESSKVDLRDIFGATEDDAARLRIASLYEVDLEAAMGLPAAPAPDNDE